MVLLDTDVISELMKINPAPKVTRWIAMRDESAYYTCAVNKAEVEHGIAILPEGKRKKELAENAAAIFARFPCLPFEDDDCPHYADIRASDKTTGKPLSGDQMIADAMVAAVARRRGMTLATGNNRHFSGVDGLAVANPWS